MNIKENKMIRFIFVNQLIATISVLIVSLIFYVIFKTSFSFSIMLIIFFGMWIYLMLADIYKKLLELREVKK